MIPLGELMQSGHPGYRAYCLGEDMDEVYHPVFFDYCINVCEVFKKHAKIHSTNSSLHHSDGTVVSGSSLFKVIDSMKAISETDEPEDVIPLRELIRESCYEFMEYCSYMKSRFEQPTSVGRFYDSLGELVLSIACNYAGVNHS